MSSAPIISVRNLGKKYRLGLVSEDFLANKAINAVKRLFRPRGECHHSEDIWALKDVSFDVMPGEVLGIIGRNGAGKSTLLKILSRITEPTEGEIHVRGRVASLLEVGTGFHPELTGRENIYLNGSILGMSQREIRAKFDKIVAFAEVEKFIDSPVKHYSSGMYVRLAFAVAAHLDPEILVVDEVLAVGDAGFQKKCLGKMGDIAREGRTVLFVSHNMNAIQNLCGRGLVLQNGQVEYSGNAGDVVAKYLHSTASQEYGFADLAYHSGRPPGMPSVIQSLAMRSTASAQLQHSIKTGDSVTFEIRYDCGDMILDYAVIGICSSLGERVATVGTHLCPDFNKAIRARGVLECTLMDMPLAEGNYSVLVALGNRIPMRNVDYIENALSFRVETSNYFGTGVTLLRGQGYLAQRSQWRIQNEGRWLE